MKMPAAEAMAKWPPSENIVQIIKFKEAHRLRFLTEHKAYLKLFEGALDVAAQSVEGLNYIPKQSWLAQRSSQYPFFPGMLESLYRACDDFMDGFYDEAAVINRAVFEGVLRIVWASLYPAQHQKIWTGNESARKGELSFNVTNFLEHQLKVDWKYLWHYSSAVAHSKRHRVISLMADYARGKPRAVTWDLGYDKDRIRHPMTTSAKLLWINLRLLIFLFPELLNDPSFKDESKERLRTAEGAFREFMSQDSNPKAAEFVRDVDKIISMIEAAETGKPWERMA